MTARAYSASLAGLVSCPATIEATPATNFDVLGMSDAAGRESRVIVRGALASVTVAWGPNAIVPSVVTVPPDSHGPRDLAIAIAALASDGGIVDRNSDMLRTTLLLAGLGLSGKVQPVRGLFPMLRGMRGLFAAAIVARDNEAEAADAAEREGLTCYVADDLADVVAHLRGERCLPTARPSNAGASHAARLASLTTAADDEAMSIADVADPHVRRVLEVAAAGSHSLLLAGPIGSGKTMLARRLAASLPQLDDATAVEVTSLHSVAGTLGTRVGMIRRAPFRAPHHSVSEAGMFGGGRHPRPGEVSLAHGGVLYLDELPEFRASIVQYLRNVVRQGFVTHAQGSTLATFPARPLVVASMNGCACGSRGANPRYRKCTCTVAADRSYRTRTDALTAWFDMRLDVSDDMHTHVGTETADEATAIRERIAAARAYTVEREGLGRVALAKSAPAWARVARTLADMDGTAYVKPGHLEEARLLARVVPS